jgi:chromosome segregation ATPase
MSTKAVQVYERVEALLAEGTEKADAFRQLATEFGQPVDSVRGAYYTGRKQASGDPTESKPRSRPARKRETTAEAAVTAAVTALENAIASINGELQDAQRRAEEAQGEYEALQATAGTKIEAIQAKIAMLSSEEAPA